MESAAFPQHGCRCGHYDGCSFCAASLEPTRLERLAMEAGVHPYYVRRYLRRRISEELRRRLFGSPTAAMDRFSAGGLAASLPGLCLDEADGDGLGALALAVDLHELRQAGRAESASVR